MGVWIETILKNFAGKTRTVTPFVGVWIETDADYRHVQPHQVTPFVGVWIETTNIKQDVKATHRHTLRGCVD